MCDTLTFITTNGTWLAKNSDRHPDEVQRVEYHPAQTLSGDIPCTYLAVKPRDAKAHATILGRPEWMWGAEMGVNEKGVAIGNEAVFTCLTGRQKISPSKLLGMDLLRLALMEAESAEQAIDCIAYYLTTYGQGGNAGYGGKQFYYDNSFLISDRNNAWVMETAGSEWAARPVSGCEAISNRLIVGDDYQKSNLATGNDFAKQYSSFLMPLLARAQTRRQQNLNELRRLNAQGGVEEIRQELARMLGSHQASGKVNTGNVCMHARGRLCPDETVNSMIAWLPRDGEPQVWMTGCSHPCQSEFKSVEWSEQHWFAQNPGYWESVKQAV